MHHARTTDLRADATPNRGAFESLLRECLKETCPLRSTQVDLLFAHYVLLSRWNRVLNLTSIRDMRAAVVRHYGESLFLEQQLSRDVESIADIGSGAGFPGIPLAALRPRCKLTLIESHQRKAVFLREATRGYSNVEVVAGRAETVVSEHEWLVSRGVSPSAVVRLVPEMAPRVALLVGRQDVVRLLGVDCLSWSEPVAIPWARQQYVLLGRHVSRGT